MAIYAEELANYEEGTEDYEAYYDQLSEQHARRAGATESLVYVEAINDYLGIYMDIEIDHFNCLEK